MARGTNGMTAARTGVRVGAIGIGLAALLAGDAMTVGAGERTPGAAVAAAWSEVKWPFPIDQWGTGRAFNCKAADCGTEVKLYLRAKLGTCNCETGVADDGDLDRMSEFDLIGGEVSPLGAGRPITIARMKGRGRAYTLTVRNRLAPIIRESWRLAM